MLPIAEQVIALDQFMCDMSEAKIDYQKYLSEYGLTLGVSCETDRDIQRVRDATKVKLAIFSDSDRQIIHVDFEYSSNIS